MSKKATPKQYPEWEEISYFPYFTELCLIHNFPPNWTPSDDWGQSSVAASQIASAARGVRQERGITDTIVGLSEKSDARSRITSAPGWME